MSDTKIERINNPLILINMDKKQIIENAQSVVVKNPRSTTIERYGFWWKKDLSDQELVERCDVKIDECKRWLENLEVLKAEKTATIKAKRNAELKELIKGMTDEEFLSLKA